MNITYIFHSGFLAETKTCYYLFDYYRGGLPELNPDKPILVFASHFHQDHYNKQVFELLRQQKMKCVYAVLSKDISRRNYPAEGVEVFCVTFDRQYGLPCETELQTFHSTDSGVAFLVTCPEGTLYHAGDLNDWVWKEEPEQANRQMTGSYRHEIQKLAGKSVDVAFLPLDPRQEEYYAEGMRYFLEKVKVKAVFPMHYWGEPEVIQKFLLEYPQYREIVKDTEQSHQKNRRKEEL